jgi:hypothetical protein
MQLWSYWKALMQMFRKQNYLNHPKLLLCNVFATDLSHCLIVLCLSWIMASSGCGNEVSSEVWAMSTLFGWKIVHPVQNFSLKIWIYWLSVRLEPVDPEAWSGLQAAMVSQSGEDSFKSKIKFKYLLVNSITTSFC